MKVTQEKLPASQVGLEIEIPPEISKNAYERVIQKYTRTANIPGFRKGKVPRQILIQRLGSSYLKAVALDEVIQDSLRKVAEREDIKAIGQFELRSEFDSLVKDFEPGKEFAFLAKVDVEPEVNIENYTGLSLKAEEVKYDPAEIDAYLEERRLELAILVPVEGRPAREGDLVLIDYSGKIVSEETEEPIEIPGGEAKDFELELKPGGFVPGFIEGIIGMNIEETKEVNVKFPADYAAENLADRDAIFTITLKEIKEKELAELDDEFAAEVGEFDTMAELRESLEKQFQVKAEEKTNLNKEIALVEEFLKLVDVEIPATMINDEVNKILTQRAMELSQYGINVKSLFTSENIPGMQERSRPEALAQLKRELGLLEVAKRESISVEEAEIEEQAAYVKQELEGQALDEEKLREIVKSDLLKQKIIEWLVERAEIELVPEGTLTPTEVEETSDDYQDEESGGETEVTVEILDVEVEETSEDDRDRENDGETEATVKSTM